MKRRIGLWLIGIILLAISGSVFSQEGLISVLNPRGTPPPIPRVPMAPRPASLDGKMIYFVDVKYEGGASLLRATIDWFTKNIPTANLVFREKAGSYDQEDAKLWAEIKEKADAVIMAIGHCSSCAPAVAHNCVRLEKLGKPTVGMITSNFVEVCRNRARESGMPTARLVFVPYPVYGKTYEQHQAYVVGKDPATGKQVIEEIIEALTKPPTEEETKTGFLERKAPSRLIGPQTPDNLQRLFMASGWTDYLPIILPTEQKVNDMLKGTSHRPDEVAGKMAGGDFEPWEFTVEKVAINAVMAGAKPEYLPVILAIASSGISSLYNSPDSLVRALVVNGPVREEIRMNFETGAMGPFSQANATIGRAWTLMSRNLSGAGIVGETYTGSQGNSLNFNNIVIAENEGRSPWVPLSIQKGFKRGDSVISLFTGLSLNAGQGAQRGGATVNPAFDRQFSSILNAFTGYFGALIVCDPLVAKSLKAQGYDTKEKLSEWIQKNTVISVADYKDGSFVAAYDNPRAKKGIEPYASWFKLPENVKIPRFASPKDIEIVVTGGEIQALFQAGNLKYLTSIGIDQWR
jgi:hypothetical protein